MVGLERTILPEIAAVDFGMAAKTAILSFIVVFGSVKAISNFYAGALANSVGRRNLLLTGWLFALPVPFMLMFAGSWSWIIATNVLLGINQGLAWSSRNIRLPFRCKSAGGIHWYHPHPHGRTGSQIYHGLAGFFIIEDKEEQALDLPSGEYKLPLNIQEKQINEQGAGDLQLQYDGPDGGFLWKSAVCQRCSCSLPRSSKSILPVAPAEQLQCPDSEAFDE